jgi:hypothetical protein
LPAWRNRWGEGLASKLTCFEYDAHGLRTAIVESTSLVRRDTATGTCAGNKTVYEYNGSGDLTGVINPRFSGAGTPKTTYSYPTSNNIGRPDSVTNELGHTISFTYDNFDKPLTETDNLGNKTTWTYDNKGNLTAAPGLMETRIIESQSGRVADNYWTGSDGSDGAG